MQKTATNSYLLTIPRRITRGEELVILPKSTYEAFQQWQWEVSDALAKVARGRRALNSGKTYTVASPKEFFT